MDLRRQITLILALGAVLVAFVTMFRMVNEPGKSLLYAGLESGAAGDVVRSLEQRGVPYEVRGGSIFVASDQRDELRLTLASEGLPANSSKGYELLDSLSGFGTTSQMFDAAYWRAKEGELARTIVASPSIASARVHIASTGSNPFQRGVVPKASVQITPNGSTTTAQQAKAIRFLVASAVAGLEPEDVAVIDAGGTLISNIDEVAVAGDEDKALALKERVERLLEARVGFGNAIVEVSVETINESEEIRERRFDPEGRVAISTDTEERTSNSSEAGGGDVTVASNLPDEAGGGGDSATSQNSETRERVNYEVSETERAVLRAPGAIKRLTVAVLVNDIADVNDAGEVQNTPRPEDELQALRELVESAVGFDAERGDVITLKSMALQSLPATGTVAETSLLDGVHIDVMSAIQMAVLAVVTLILGLFVVRPLLASPKSQNAAEESLSLPASAQTSGAEAGLPAPEDIETPSDLPDLDLGGDFGELPDLPGFPNMSMGSSDDPVDRLRTMIGDRQEESVQILRTWLEEDRAERAQ
jgi:flagellar M-ring protein FliF